MVGQSRDNALDHVVVVVFENRSLDNVLGRLYGPEDGKTFEGVTGKDLTNPIPEWAEHGADRKVVPYTVATDMDSPNPDTGEEYPHTNTQLFGILSEANRFKLGEEITAPYNAPEPGQAPTMDGFVTDYVSTLTAELGRQPTYEEYSQVMTGFTPEQIPVLSGLARGFGVFDHWFCEVPSQTFTNRSFWTAATASGMVVNQPVKNWLAGNTAETIFKFDRSGYRVPAILVSPWVAEGEVFNQEHRHTSLIATLREQWDLGDPLTGRDAAAQTFSHAFTLNTPRDPATWPTADPRPVPQYIQDALGLGQVLSAIGKTGYNGIRAYAEQHNIKIEGLPDDPNAEIPPDQALHIIHNFLAIQFPLLHPATPGPGAET